MSSTVDSAKRRKKNKVILGVFGSIVALIAVISACSGSSESGPVASPTATATVEPSDVPTTETAKLEANLTPKQQAAYAESVRLIYPEGAEQTDAKFYNALRNSCSEFTSGATEEQLSINATKRYTWGNIDAVPTLEQGAQIVEMNRANCLPV